MNRKSAKNYNSALLELFEIKPIAYNPVLAKISKSAKAGLFLSQILYWWGKGANPDWIYKTIDEITEETGLSRGEQDTAIKIWKGLEVIKTKLKGIPPKRHFHVDTHIFIRLLRNYMEQSNLSKPANQFAETNNLIRNSRQNTTESTSENTDRDSVIQTDFIKSRDLMIARFEAFWDLYPRRVEKKDAFKQWVILRPDNTIQEKIMRALEQQIKFYQWRKDDAQFIPHPNKWLKDKRWTDEIEVKPSSKFDNLPTTKS